MMTALPSITGPSVWCGQDHADSTAWIRPFRDNELAELDTATAAIKARGLGPFDFGRADFPLPNLGPALTALLTELEGGRGFTLLRGLPVSAYDETELDILYAGLSTYLGRVITQNSRGDRIGRVADHGTDYGTRNVRGHTSNGAIAPHCDSSDLVGLLCVQSAGEGGESKVASAMTVYNTILAEHPEYVAALTRGFHINLAGKGPTGELNECSQQRIPIFSYYAGKLSCRYNRKQILDAAQILNEALSDLEKAAIDAVGDVAMRDNVRLDMDFRPGDIQLLNNHCILHARNAFQDEHAGGRRRRLLRIWINMETGRALAPEFADRLNTGPRGEVHVRT